MFRKQHESDGSLPIWLIPIIIGGVASVAIALLGSGKESNFMTWGEVIAIVVALISVAGGIWTQLVQFKRDGKTIGSIKADTSEMQPKVDIINKNIDKIKDDVMEKMVPTMDRLNRSSENSSMGLRELVEDLHYKQRLKAETSVSVDRDYLMADIDKLYTENARLVGQTKNLSVEIKRLTAERNQLKKENQYLQQQLSQYVPRTQVRDHHAEHHR